MNVSQLKPGQLFTMPTDKRRLRMLAFDKGSFAVDTDNNLVALHPDSYVEVLGDEPPAAGGKLAFDLFRANRHVTGNVTATPDGIRIEFDGYGRRQGEAPLSVWLNAAGHPMVTAYTEAASIDPSHVFHFDGARKN